MLTQAFINQPTPPTTIPPGAYYWSRVVGPPSYLYPTNTADTVRVDAGSVTNPSYGFLNTAAALLTGMYYPAANTIGFTSNGTQVGTFSTTLIYFPGVTGAASTAGSAVGIGTGAGGTGGADGGQYSLGTGNGSANAASTGGGGGVINITSGNGAASTVAFAAGVGGTITTTTGNGGAQTGGAAGAGGNGGTLAFILGAGGATNNVSNLTGGAAGNFTITGAAGGAVTGVGATGAAGNGSSFTFTGGTGGNGTSGTGGVGGQFTVTCGGGGNATAGTNNGRVGGAITGTAGNGGTTTGGSAGGGGAVSWTSGRGASQTNSINGGIGGNVSLIAERGGNNTGAAATGNGGAGGRLILTAGNGGSTNSTGAGVSAGQGKSVEITGGDGGNNTGGGHGGNASDCFFNGGNGGSHTGGGTTGNGGNGGGFQIFGGAAGTTNSTGSANGGAGAGIQIGGNAGGAQTGAGASGNGGAGGSFDISCGAGGAASGAGSTGNGGAGGGVTLTPANGGTTVGGTAGAQGRVKVQGTGIFAFANAQSITPAATHTLILTATAGANQSVVSSTFIKVASDAAGRKILLPTEASSNGLYLIFANTSATNTLVLRDSADTTTIATMAVSSQCEVMCDGTTWYACGFGSASSGVGGYWSLSGTTLLPSTHGNIVTAPVQGVGNRNECFGTASSIGGGGIENTTCGANNTIPLNGGYNTLLGSNNQISVAGGGVQYNIIVGNDCVLSQASVGCILMGFQSQTIGAGAYADIVLIGGRSCASYSNFTTSVGSGAGVTASAAYASSYGYQAISGHVGSIALGANSMTSAASQCVIGGTVAAQGAITEVLIGNGASAASPNSPNVEPTQATGTDKNGGSFTLRGGRNTGSGAGGQLLFDIYPAGSTGTTAGTATNMQRVVSTYYNERRAGSGTTFGGIPARIFNSYTDSTSSGTSAQNLHSFTLIGNTLLHDGDTIEFYSTMALTTLGGNLTVAFRLGSTDLTMFNAAAPAGATQATYRVRCIRTGAATQRVEGTITINATVPYVNTIYTTMAETLANNLTIANRITATVSGTVTNSITTVMYEPAPQT